MQSDADRAIDAALAIAKPGWKPKQNAAPRRPTHNGNGHTAAAALAPAPEPIAATAEPAPRGYLLDDCKTSIEAGWLAPATPEQAAPPIEEPPPPESPDEYGVAPKADAAAAVPIDLVTAFTFLGDAPAAPPRELIKKLLPAEGVAVTGGQSGAGKTFIIVHRSICLATGMPYFGHKIAERVGTAFIAAEGVSLIPNRFAAALAKHGIKERLPIAWIKQLPDFASERGCDLFIRQMEALDKQFRADFGVRLGHIPIDTIAACFAMKDEDDNAEATRICNKLRYIGDRTGALASPVHHFGKNADSGLRGASAWKGSADVIEAVLADIDPLSGRASNRELVCAKARDGEQGPLSAFSLEFVELGTDPDGEAYGSCCVMPAEGQSRFAKAAGMSKSQRTFHDAFHEVLADRGKILTPRTGMAAVKAVLVADVREEFERRYVTAEADEAKAANAKRMAFKRALDHLSPTQFGAGSADGSDWLWRIS